MLKGERHRKILQSIDGRKELTVRLLSQEFGVSEMTIRRDLTELDSMGLLQRIHGGALNRASKHPIDEPPILERARENSDEKDRIGRAAAGLIKDGEKVFLSSGTTTLAIARAIKGRNNLTVITNALNIANELISSHGITLILIGGFLRRTELSLIGHFTEAALKGLRVDKVLFGIRGIDPVHGLTSDNLQELITDQAILQISKTIIIVADHTKFGKVAAIRTAPLNAASRIISGVETPPEFVDVVRKMGVEVTLV
jgi:DeoR family transcriptional regulator of aga operon